MEYKKERSLLGKIINFIYRLFNISFLFYLFYALSFPLFNSDSDLGIIDTIFVIFCLWIIPFIPLSFLNYITSPNFSKKDKN